MSAKTTRTDNGDVEQILAEARQLRARRGNIYRDQALKILPWICAWCGREFTSKKLHELTVHHKRSQSQQQSARRQQLGAAMHVLSRQRALPLVGSGRDRRGRGA